MLPFRHTRSRRMLTSCPSLTPRAASSFLAVRALTSTKTQHKSASRTACSITKTVIELWHTLCWRPHDDRAESNQNRELTNIRMRGMQTTKSENNLAVGVIEDLYAMSQVAQILRCSRKTIYRLISSGRLRAVRWGRSYRFRREDVQEFVRSSLITHRRAEGRATQLTS